MDTIVVRCQFCGKLFTMRRPLFFTEREHTACPACWKQAEENTAEMNAQRRTGVKNDELQAI